MSTNQGSIIAAFENFITSTVIAANKLSVSAAFIATHRATFRITVFTTF